VPGFPQATDDGDASHLTPGTKVPPVALPATDGTAVNLAALQGWSVIAVYPWTGRPGFPNPPDWDRIRGAHGSTPELAGFRDRHADFTQEGLRLFGLSRQDTAYQRELVARLGLPFPLLSDDAGAFGAALALPTFATGGTNYLKRLTLLIASGRIERAFYPVIDPAGHAAEVLREVKASRAD
jgi:peroxiredoxin